MFGLGVLRLRKRMKRKKQNLSYPIFVCLDCKISWPIFTNLFKNSSFSICLSYEIIQTLRTVNENCLNLFFSFKFKIMDETFLNLCFLTTYLIKKKKKKHFVFNNKIYKYCCKWRKTVIVRDQKFNFCCNSNHWSFIIIIKYHEIASQSFTSSD